jgi:secreted Zn-dependent insulinase-like peptidase
LIKIREEIKNITEEVIEVQKKSVHTQIAEKDINLNRENGRFWNEIASHQYEFERQSKSISALATITKAEFIAHFEEVFFSPTAKRMDLELTSTPHEEEQAKYLESNKEHEIFKQLKRVVIEDSVEDFKSKCAKHPNFYKECFLKFRA